MDASESRLATAGNAQVNDRQGSRGLSYAFNARVLRHTDATIVVPPRVNAGGRVTYRGRISAASDGSVLLELRTGTHSASKKIAVVTLRPTGVFAFTTRVARPGTNTIRVIYRGDQSHSPSSATASFKDS